MNHLLKTQLATLIFLISAFLLNAQNKISSFPFYENFDSSSVAWSNVSSPTDQFDWTTRSGSTPSSNTGPSHDHTTQNTSYIYFETSSPAYPSKTAMLESPEIDLNSLKTAKFYFWYHMYGSTMGNLKLEVFDGTKWNTAWTKSGDQGNKWIQDSINLASYGKTIKLRFTGTSGSGYRSDMALDDLLVTGEKPDYDLDIVNVYPNVLNKGANQVQVLLKNNGKKDLGAQQLYVHYKYSSNWIKDTLSLISLKSGETKLFSFSKSLVSYTFGKYNLCVKLDPQLSNDPDLGDTYCKLVSLGLSDTFVIDSAGKGDFPSVDSALSFAKAYGISGNTYFKIKTGTYSGRLEIDSTLATNINKQIYFIADSNSRVTLDFSATSISNRSLLALTGAKYLHFKNIHFVARGLYAACVFMTKNVKYIHFENCSFSVPAINSQNYVCIFSSNMESYFTSGNNASDISIKKCTFEGGANALILSGNYYNYSKSNKIIGCTFNQTSNVAITLSNNLAAHVSNNYISSANGLILSYNKRSLVNANEFSKSERALSIRSENTNSIYDTSLFTNNMIHSVLSNATNTVNLSSSANIRFEHNSIDTRNTLSSNVELLTLLYSNHINLSNNIFTAPANNNIYRIYQSSDIYSNFNNFYAGNKGFLMNIEGQTITNLSELQQLSLGTDQQSFNQKPGFISSSNLHLDTLKPIMLGKGLGILYDFDGEKRYLNYACIGADHISLPANDLDITRITSPKKLINGLNPVNIEVLNTGSKKINLKDVSFAYKIENGIWTSDSFRINKYLASLDTAGFGFSKGIQFTSSGIYEICARINKQIAGDPDSLDMVCTQVCSQFPDTLTIDQSGNGNYESFHAVVKDLITCGIDKPLVILVKEGIYNEQLEIPAIQGSSKTNTITFVGEPGKNIILKYNTSSYSNRYTLFLNNTKHILFKHIQFENTATYAINVFFSENSDSNTFENCSFRLAQATYNSYNRIHISLSGNITNPNNGIHVQGTVFSNCNFENGNYGIYFTGNNKYPDSKIIIDQCVFSNIYNSAIVGRYLSDVHITHNNIYPPVYDISSSVSMYSCNRSMINGNTLSGGQRGILLTYENRLQSGDTSYVFNNMIYPLVNEKANASIECSYSYRIKIYNNSILHFSSDSSLYSTAIFLNYTDNSSVVNNILYSKGESFCFSDYHPTTVNEVDFNNYYSANSRIAYQNATPFYSLGKWKKTVTSKNKNSVSVQPAFRGKNDMHLKSAHIPVFGFNNGLKTDIDGEQRKNRNMIGADQIPLSTKDLDVAEIVYPKSPSIGNNSITAQLINMGTSALHADSIEIAYSVDGGKQVKESFVLPSNFKSFDTLSYTFKTPWKNQHKGIFDICVELIKSISSDPDTTNIYCTTICNGMSDTFYIDPNGWGDFLTLDDALYQFENCGIMAETHLILTPGTYSDRIDLSNLSGLDTLNRLYIESQFPDSAIIAFKPINNQLASIVLNQSQYVVLKNLKIVLDASSGYGAIGVLLSNKSAFNIIENCSFESQNPTSSNTSFIIGSASEQNIYQQGTNASNTIIRNCSFNGANQQILLNGENSNPNSNNQIISNTFQHARSYINLIYLDATRLEGNYFINSSSNYSCISTNYCSNTKIIKNHINPGTTAIELFREGYGQTHNNTLIANNMIYDNYDNNYPFGIRLSSSTDINIYHNTIRLKALTSYAYASGIYSYVSENLNIENNIIALDGLGYGYSEYDRTTNPNIFLDYNNYFMQNQATIARLNSANYSDLQSWQQADHSNNINSTSQNVAFYSPVDAHIFPGRSKPLYGKYLNIDFDIDNEPRNTTKPLIGADEYPVASRDLDIIAIDSPLILSTANTISIRVINSGTDTLPTGYYTFSYQVDQNPAVVDSFLISSSWLPFSEKLFTFSQNFNSSGKSTLNICTRIVKAISGDPDSSDVFCKKICVPLQDSFVIDQSGQGDFLSISEAIDRIYCAGLAGNTLFFIKNGTYNERLVLPELPGSSAANTLKFIGESNDSTVIIYNPGSKAYDGELATIALKGTDYVGFENLKISNPSTTSALGIHLSKASDHIYLKNCKIQVYSDTTSSNSGIGLMASSFENLDINSIYSFTGNNCNYLTVDSCEFIGGAHGMVLIGSDTSMQLGNQISNNIFKQQIYYNIRFYYQQNILIEQNNLLNSKYYSGPMHQYGIYGNRSNGSKLLSNRILNSLQGIFLYSENINNGSDSCVIANNMISNTPFPNIVYGIALSNVQNVRIYHNSLNTPGYKQQPGISLYLYSTSNSNVLNNIFQAEGSVCVVQYDGYGITSNINYDYNNYINSQYYVSNINNVTFNSLAEWQKYHPQNNIHSWSLHPGFKSLSDLHIKTPAKNNLIGPRLFIDKDFDNDPRKKYGALIGADEYLTQPVDVDLLDITKPEQLFLGSNSVRVKLRNTGNDSLHFAKINLAYQVNNMAWVRDSFTSSANWESFQTHQFDFTKKLNISQKGEYDVCVKLDPGLIGDPDSVDQICKHFCTAMSDTFVIDASGHGDFITFSEAIDRLKCGGIDGDVVFIVENGTYSDSIQIGLIKKTKPGQKISFIGRNKDKCIIHYRGYGQKSSAVIAINALEDITFKNLTIINDGYYASGIFIGLDSRNITIDHCVVKILNGNIYQNIAIYSSSEQGVTYNQSNRVASNIKITNCIIDGGYIGIRLSGSLNIARGSQNIINNNIFENQYSNAIYCIAQDSMVIGYNSILADSNVSTIINYGIYSLYNARSFIYNNKISRTRYAILSHYENTGSSDSSLYYNNYINFTDNSSAPTGIYLNASFNVHIYHNSIKISGISSTYSGNLYLRSNSNCQVKNNILYNKGYAPLIYGLTNNFAQGAIDFNNYFMENSGNAFNWDNVSYTDLTSWKSAFSNFNQHSSELDPKFKSANDLHLRANSPELAGYYLGIDFDFDNDARCLISPTMGADENIHPSTPPVAGFTSDDTLCFSSPMIFRNTFGVNDIKFHKWYINGNFVSDKLHLVYSFDKSSYPAGSKVTVSLITEDCGGIDTFEQSVLIDSPLYRPQIDFIASKTEIEEYQSVSFSDLSLKCPETWIWHIWPDSIFDPLYQQKVPTYDYIKGTDSMSQNPIVQFNYEGSYDVCLESSNVKGMGAQNCKTSYINVFKSYLSCIFPFESKAKEGIYFDDGGVEFNYSKDQSCEFLIKPCASEVQATLQDFDLEYGDYLRIYDGINKGGKALWNVSQLGTMGLGNSMDTNSSNFQKQFTARSGAMYVQFESDNYSEGRGFNLFWTSIDSVYAPPQASFNISDDTICLGETEYFMNTSKSSDADYAWDVDGDGFDDYFSPNPEHVYFMPGTYMARLRVSDCGGVSEYFKKIIVRDPSMVPKPKFSISNNKPAVGEDLVYLEDKTYGCIDTWEWEIWPKSYTIVSGGLNTAKIGIKFNTDSCYSVRLKVGWRSFYDSTRINCGVKPVIYCFPKFLTTSNNYYISAFKLGEIQNNSGMLIKGYSNYTSIGKATLEKGAAYDLTIDKGYSKSANFKVYIDYNQDGHFSGSGELLCSAFNISSQIWTKSIRIPKWRTNITTRLRVMIMPDTAWNKPCGENYTGETEDYLVKFIDDKTPPEFALLGYDTVYVEECKTWVDPGYSAIDNVDGNLQTEVVVIGKVNTAVPDTYNINYFVSDSIGNAAKPLHRTVIVEPDHTPPYIGLLGANPDTLHVYGKKPNYKKLYNAYDNCSGIDSLNVSDNIDTSNIGKFKVRYYAKDFNGNDTTVFRAVYVVDTLAPVISLPSKDTVYLCRYDKYKPLIFVQDNYDPVINVIYSGSYVNEYELNYGTGLFELDINAKDRSDNVSNTLKIWIRVEEFDTCSSSLVDKGENEFLIYPNPNVGSFVIDLESKQNSKYSLEIINSLGQSVYRNNGDVRPGRNHIYIRQLKLAEGIYYLNFSSAEIRGVHKIIITKSY